MQTSRRIGKVCCLLEQNRISRRRYKCMLLLQWRAQRRVQSTPAIQPAKNHIIDSTVKVPCRNDTRVGEQDNANLIGMRLIEIRAVHDLVLAPQKKTGAIITAHVYVVLKYNAPCLRTSGQNDSLVKTSRHSSGAQRGCTIIIRVINTIGAAAAA
jgi:hypothetical protein